MSQGARVYLGTSAFTAAGWAGSFYPAGLKPAEFIFAAKIPQTITHERVLVGCGDELKKFLAAMDCLREKLGPLLFQFGYFNKSAFTSVNQFLLRLAPFLGKLPKGYKFAVEIRNKQWLAPRFVDALRHHGVALALIDQSWMPRPAEWFKRLDPITADFAYIRWLGDRKGIEEQTKTWDKTAVDRSSELREWVNVVYKINGRGIPVFAYANNHYAGHAPATIALFRDLWRHQTKAELATPHQE